PFRRARVSRCRARRRRRDARAARTADRRAHRGKKDAEEPAVKSGGPALAKLTRPKIYDAIPRPRLFSLLDEAGKRPIVWGCAPPRAGKTTLRPSLPAAAR